MMNMGGGFDLLGKSKKKASTDVNANRDSGYGSTDRAQKSKDARKDNLPKSVTFDSKKGSNFFSNLDASAEESETRKGGHIGWELDEETAALLMDKDETITVSSGGSSVRDIPLPMKLRPFVKRLEDLDDLADEEILNIVFIVRLGKRQINSNQSCHKAEIILMSYFSVLSISMAQATLCSR